MARREKELADIWRWRAGRRRSVSPLALGKMLLEHRVVFDVTQRDLAEKLGISVTSIHHYESLPERLVPELQDAVEKGRLNLKKARALADIEDPDRQREAARLLLDGRLTSVYIEAFVALVRKHPELSTEEILDQIQVVVRAHPELSAEAARRQIQRKVSELRRKQVFWEMFSTTALQFSKGVAALLLEDVSERRRSDLIAVLKALDARVQAALEHLGASPN